MMHKNVIIAITATVSLSIIASVGLGTYVLTNRSQDNDKETIKPLNRGNDYEKVDLSTYLDKAKIMDLIMRINQEKQFVFNEDKFKNNIEFLVRNALSKIDRFKNHASEYKIILSYQFNEEKAISIDVVWHLPKTNPYHYYDQFQILLREI